MLLTYAWWYGFMWRNNSWLNPQNGQTVPMNWMFRLALISQACQQWKLKSINTPSVLIFQKPEYSLAECTPLARSRVNLHLHSCPVFVFFSFLPNVNARNVSVKRDDLAAKRQIQEDSNDSGITNKYLEVALLADEQIVAYHGDLIDDFLLLIGSIVSIITLYMDSKW